MSAHHARAGADVVFRSRRVVTPAGVAPASVHVRGGVIAALRAFDDLGDATEVIDAGDAALLPGLVDTHVHVNDPGRTDWEGFASATAAAAAGGVTTLVDMPLNSVPATTTVDALRTKIEAARDRCRVDVGFWGGVVPGNTPELAPLVHAGALGFKCFLVPSGVEEFAHVGEAELAEAMPVVARLGVPLLVHAELPGPIQAALAGLADAAPATSHAAWLASRPEAAETEAVELLIRLCRASGARVHIVHVSAATVLALIRTARARGLPISAETCPHYLHFAAEEVPDGGTAYKCAPPIRSRSNREGLWRGLAEGDLDLIASDHSPCPPELKRLDDGDFVAAWGGIASLELGLSVVWTGASRRGHGLDAIARWMSQGPARLAGLGRRKGGLVAGLDADVVVFDPEAERTVDATRLHQRHPVTPYAGEKLRGVVEATYLRGELIHRAGEPMGEAGGRLLLRDGEGWNSRT
ncbi:MAG TPA: allantoinase AllB [Longimicrobiales bacterium]|nr:allantoinase AllB [Longimicrobiales bacterium]